MGQQPSTAGKARRKPKKVITDGALPSSALYDEDDDEQPRPPVVKTSPNPSPTDMVAKRKTSQEPTKALGPSLSHSPHPSPSSSPNASPKDTSPRLTKTLATAAVAVAPSSVPATDGFTSDKANPFCGPVDDLRNARSVEDREVERVAASSHFDVPTLRQLHAIFTDISTSSTVDDVIDAQELTQAMGLDNDCLLARAIFRIFDKRKTKSISWDTWVETLSALSARASIDDKILFSFRLYDLNDDGSIDLHELRALLAAAVRENVLSLTEAQVQAFCDHTLRDVDRDGNGMVEYDEYKQMVLGSRKFIESFTMDVPAMLHSFRLRRGEVTEEEARIKRDRFKGRDKREPQHTDSEEDLSAEAALATAELTAAAAAAQLPTTQRKSSHNSEAPRTAAKGV